MNERKMFEQNIESHELTREHVIELLRADRMSAAAQTAFETYEAEQMAAVSQKETPEGCNYARLEMQLSLVLLKQEAGYPSDIIFEKFRDLQIIAEQMGLSEFDRQIELHVQKLLEENK